MGEGALRNITQNLWIILQINSEEKTMNTNQLRDINTPRQFISKLKIEGWESIFFFERIVSMF